jgi:hypothetical protein
MFLLITLSEFNELVKILAWPIVVLIALVVFRKILPPLILELGRRATKLSVLQFTVELSTVSEFKPAWSGANLSDVRQPSPAAEFTSGATALLEEIKKDDASDYAIVDLGEGQQWLTSRLFIFAIMLKRMRGLRSFVFLETSDEVRRKFVGIASPDEVRWNLARRYPWFEDAFAVAYSKLPNRQIQSHNGSLEVGLATELIRLFLEGVQTAQEPKPLTDEWVTLKGSQKWEHAQWINGTILTSIFRDILQESWMPESLDMSASERAQGVLRRKGPFVALVEDGRRFKSLVDRQALLDQVASRVSEIRDKQ